MRAVSGHLFWGALMLSLASLGQSDNVYDVVIYSATPAGLGAAFMLANLSSTVSIAVLEPSGYVGGMASPGGIGLRDHRYAEEMSDNELVWGMLNARYYNSSEPVWQPDNHVGHSNFLTMIRQWKNIHLYMNTSILEDGGVAMDGARITAISTDDTNTGGSAVTWRAQYFVDASYEGDLMAYAGASMTFGRESRDTYNESYAGVTDSSQAQFDVYVDPEWNDGSLLSFLRNGPDPRTHLGQADHHVMAYSFRACLSLDPDNQVPVPRPDGYNTSDFEIARRFLAGELAAKKSLRLPWGNLPYSAYPPNNKRDACCGSGPVGIDAPGLEYGYVNGTRAQRRAIYDLIKYYVQGIMYFWFADPDANVPADVRKEQFDNMGLCKDEWPENGHFPPQLCVSPAFSADLLRTHAPRSLHRKAALIAALPSFCAFDGPYQLVLQWSGDQVYVQNDRVEASAENCRNDSIGLAVWGIDIHEMQRTAVVDDTNTSRKKAYNEGLTSPSMGGAFWFELPYYLLLPKRAEITNALSPNTPSTSHVTFASIRVEPTLWRMGEASGAAIHIALNNNNQALHDVNVSAIQDILLDHGVPYHYPFRSSCEAPLPPTPQPAPPGCTEYTLSKAGSSTVNGVYTKNGSAFDGPNGVSIYQYENQYHIAVSGHTIFYAADATNESEPPVAGWTPVSGSAPAPLVNCTKTG
ncbi:uncharacterized protein MONBRDRAFT_29401 [Monosiga brevicollis MX1]|uniref:FAD dependent oxidoreductase n=1 Tax=Monosiga brevicollis TaxID=81824 RepID=A9VAZ6_MONBE|nr:uncharacterized protein MONBRDRAFT_29401 [Monosiga brevicollis MX1]EDQ85303.1 predicted protein [Monosiga brevicollis MX1]|eukprot:XP_001749924.1 hypothetical protein [Monosiga brevicollis MX1]